MQKLTGPAPHWPGAQLTMRAGMFKPHLKQHALRFWCPHRVPFLPHTLHFYTGFSIGSSCGHGCYSSLLWGQHWARLPLQAVAASRLTLYPANLLHISSCNKQTNKKIQETFVNLRFAQLQSGLQVPPFLHFSTSLPLPLSPEHKSHIQGIMINVCNQIPTKQRLSTAILLICQDARGAHPYSPFITLGQLQNKTKHPPIQNYFYTHALRALPITLISDPPSCHSTCLILRGLQMQAFFMVLDCLCAERGKELHLLRL